MVRMQLRRFILLLLVIGSLVGMVLSDPVHDAIRRGLEEAKQVILVHEAVGLALFVVLSVVSAIAFFFSTAVVVPVAIYAWGKTATILLLWGSWLIGAAVSYWIGLRPGRRLARWLVSERRVAEYEDRVSANATFLHVLLFQIAVPSEIPGYVLGALRYDFRRYLGARAIAELPFAIGVVYLGDTFVQRQLLPLIAIAVGGLLLSAAALYLLHRRVGR